MAIKYLDSKRIRGSSVGGKVGDANWKSTTGNSGIQLGTSAIITGDFTVGMWIKKNNTQTACVFATDDAGAGSGNITLKWHSNSAYAMWLVYDASTHIKAVSDSYHSETGVWRHVTVTGINNSGTLNLTMYVDGVSKGTATDSTPTRSDDNIKTIGNEPTAGDGLIGELDEFFIYNRGLSISEVLSIANGSKKPDDATLNTSSSLRCYLPLDSDYNDTSGQSNNGSESSVGSLDGNGSLVSLESQDDKATLITEGTNSDWTNTTGWTFGSNKHTVNNSTASVTRLTYYDLGANQPDGWVVRFKMAVAGWQNNGSAGQGIHFDIGMVDDATSSTMNNENITGLDSVYMRMASGEWACHSTNGSSTLNYAQFNVFSRPYTATYWVEIRKLSSTQAQVKLWLSSDYTGTVAANSSVMTLSANPDCRYIFARLFYQSVTSDNTIDISEFEYYNSLTTSGTPTYETDFAEPFSNLPENTLFEETDTYKTYWLQSNAWTINDLTRGLTCGGTNGGHKDIIDYVTIATTGNAVDFGNLTVARYDPAAFADATRGVCAGGASGSVLDTIDYVTVATAGNATDFGNMIQQAKHNAGLADATRGCACGGDTGSSRTDAIDYVTIQTTGNATDFGNLLDNMRSAAGLADSTRGIIAGGYTANITRTIRYITIQSTGNATTFGDVSPARQHCAGLADETRGLIGGGEASGYVNTIEYITIQTAADATDFGDLTHVVYVPASFANATRGVWAGGGDSNDAGTNVMGYVTIQTTGNATDFGDLTRSDRYTAGLAA